MKEVSKLIFKKESLFEQPEKWKFLISRGQHPPLLMQILTKGYNYYTKPVLEFDFVFKNHIRVDGNSYLLKKEWEEYVKNIRKKQRKNKYYLLHQAQKYYEIIEELEIKAFELINSDYKRMSNGQMKTLLFDFFETLSRSWAYTYFPWAVEEILKEDIIRELKKIPGTDIDETYSKISKISKETYAIQEKKAFLRLAMGNQDIELLKKHVDEYSWIGFYFFFEKSFTLKDLRQRLDSVKNPKQMLDEIEKKRVHNYNEFKKIINENHINGDLLHNILLLREYIFLRTYRTERKAYAHSVIKPFISEIAQRLGISYDDLIFLTVNEINTEEFSKKMIEQRKKDFIWVLDNGEMKIVMGPEMEKLRDSFRENVDLSVEMIKGTVANKGFAKGHVKIINSQYDRESIKNFEKGEILVASMTTPDFINAINKASAIVTNEGGILCHAAIVAREMNIPCVIGTKVATKVLKDGDFVEVDADNGIVRKIK
ncbi:MAG: PEP-utilizing enzyme [Candidatus Woesearchaeota archaeon]